MVRIRQLFASPRAALGGVLASAVLVGALGAVVPTAGATTIRSASPSAFCTTLLKLSKVKQPTTSNVNNYRKWLKTYLPYYKTLASEAPASTKGVLNEMVTLMQYEYKTTSAIKLEGYIATHSKQWVNGWKAFTTAAISCATQLYG